MKIVEKFSTRKDFYTLCEEAKGEIRFAKVVTCKFCDEELFNHDKEDPATRKRIGQMNGRVILLGVEHAKVCSEKPEAPCLKKPEEELAKADKGETLSSCPCCGQIMVTRTLLRHLHRKHLVDLALSMPNNLKHLMVSQGLPIVYGIRNAKQKLFLCCECGKGGLQGGHNNYGLLPEKTKFTIGTMMGPLEKIKTKHEKCCEKFADHSFLFQDEDVVDQLPYDIKTNKTSHSLVGSSADAPINTVVLQSEDSKDLSEIKDAFNRLKEEFHPEDEDEDGEMITPSKLADIILKQQKEDEKDLKQKTRDLHVLDSMARKLVNDTERTLSIKQLATKMEGLANPLLEMEEAIKERVEAETRKMRLEIARLRKELSEKEEFQETFQSLKFGQGGRISHVDDSDDD